MVRIRECDCNGIMWDRSISPEMNTPYEYVCRSCGEKEEIPKSEDTESVLATDGETSGIFARLDPDLSFEEFTDREEISVRDAP